MISMCKLTLSRWICASRSGSMGVLGILSRCFISKGPPLLRWLDFVLSRAPDETSFLFEIAGLMAIMWWDWGWTGLAWPIWD